MGINFQEVWLASLMEFALWDEETIYLDSIKLVPDRMDPRNYFWKKIKKDYQVLSIKIIS